MVDYNKNYGWMEKISLGLLYPPNNPELRRRLFKATLRSVQLEISSFCNRHCSFCSNFIYGRHSNNIFMPDDIIVSILEQLAAINFSGKLAFHRFNEPLAYKEKLLEEISLARHLLPNAMLYTNTNGDYLTSEIIHELQVAGLNTLNVQIYDSKSPEPDLKELKSMFSEQINKSGIQQYTWLTPLGELHPKAMSNYNGMLVSFNYTNPSIFSDRGRVVSTKQQEVRTAPCIRVLFDLYLDYTGYAVPCCSIRSDVQEHQHYILGHMSEMSLMDIYFSTALAKWRRKLLFFAENGHSAPCTNCYIGGNVDTPKLRDMLEEVCCTSINDFKQEYTAIIKKENFLSKLFR